MEVIRLNLVKEPRGNLYRGLLDFAIGKCETALLVMHIARRETPLGASGQVVLSQLDPFLEQAVESSEWPGTQLLGWTAWVFQYSFTSECAEILKQSAVGLYSWEQPDLPEDLCLLRKDERPWLVSIAHEKDGYLDLTWDEKAGLFEALPAFESLVEEEKVDDSASVDSVVHLFGDSGSS